MDALQVIFSNTLLGRLYLLLLYAMAAYTVVYRLANLGIVLLLVLLLLLEETTVRLIRPVALK